MCLAGVWEKKRRDSTILRACSVKLPKIVGMGGSRGNPRSEKRILQNLREKTNNILLVFFYYLTNLQMFSKMSVIAFTAGLVATLCVTDVNAVVMETCTFTDDKCKYAVNTQCAK